MTVDMLLVVFRVLAKQLDKITVSRDKKIAKEAKIIQDREERIEKHELESKRAAKAAEKMKEFLV